MKQMKIFFLAMVLTITFAFSSEIQNTSTVNILTVSDKNNLYAKDMSKEITQLVLGVFCGECNNDCARMYRYSVIGNKESLSVDYTDSYFQNGVDSMVFETEIVDLKKKELFQDLIKHIPKHILLREKSNQIFGCPDCNDGCGIYLEIMQNQAVKRIKIDCQKSKLTDDMKYSLTI
jgi:hypothetical protein